MNLVAVIERMEAQGMDPAAILVAVKCMAAEQDEAIERRRAGDRQRQAKHREKAKEDDGHALSRDITVDERDTCDGDGKKERFPHTPSKEKINTTTRARTKSDLPDDWEPDAKTWALADELGFTSQEAWDQLERMRDWAKNADGGKGRKSDWNAAFRNWLKRTADDRSNRRNRTQAPSKPTLHDGFAILDAVTDEAIRRAGGRGEEGGEEDFGGIPGLRKSAA